MHINKIHLKLLAIKVLKFLPNSTHEKKTNNEHIQTLVGDSEALNKEHIRSNPMTVLSLHQTMYAYHSDTCSKFLYRQISLFPIS